ncbi:MAG: glycoside hydrolase family 1 protein [Sphingomonadales bacterium]|nr:glycoside hydrolase family 1 protein [Sphingomonadales bacterium]MDE2167863.1 glycoside hydrolase family 1 protein [Sphingomonadales bacterium]
MIDPRISRRSLIAGAAAMAASPAFAATRQTGGQSAAAFPKGFLWGAATAGHQIEGNNTNSDQWLLENVTPTITGAPSGDAVNSFELWRDDLDLAKSIGLNAFRFSLEWARIEPEPGMFSRAMLDHYKAIIDGCRARGMAPVVTFNHYTTPRWFATQGGWLHPQAPELFTRFCDHAARHLAGGIAVALTLNEPNLPRLLPFVLPPQFIGGLRANLAAAAKAAGVPRFVVANTVLPEDVPALTAAMIKGHHGARAAIKAVRPDLPLGFSLSIADDEAVGEGSIRDKMRGELYGEWLEVARGDDFVAIQNYERILWGKDGRLPAPAGSVRNFRGAEVYAPSLANAARYAHAATGKPVLITEHGVGTDDDTIRVNLIREALRDLRQAMAEGLPVQGYIHWTLMDNYEWGAGIGHGAFGLASVDPVTFRRTPKPSADVLGAIARANAL